MKYLIALLLSASAVLSQPMMFGTVPSLKSGMVAWWTFNEGSGTKAMDYGGLGFNGTISGSVWTNGIVGGAMYFGGSAYIDITGIVSTSTNFTFCSWVKSSTTTANSYLLDFGSGRLVIALISDASPQAGVYSGSWARFVQAPTNGWNHLAFVCSGTASQLYTNGVLASSAGYSGKQIGGGARIASQYNLTTDTVTGTLDDMRIYNRALSASEIAQLYNGGYGR